MTSDPVPPDRTARTSDTIRLWTRPELEEAAALEPEGRTMLYAALTPLLILRLVEFVEQKGERVEMVSAYGDPSRCELRFFRRDGA